MQSFLNLANSLGTTVAHAHLALRVISFRASEGGNIVKSSMDVFLQDLDADGNVGLEWFGILDLNKNSNITK